MADRKLIDLGFSVAILSEDDTGEPMMTLFTPETDEDEPKCMYVIGSNESSTTCAVRWPSGSTASTRTLRARMAGKVMKIMLDELTSAML